MKKAGIVFLLFLTIFLVLNYRYSIVKRTTIFLNQDIHGKVWQNEVEKETQLYSQNFSIVFVGDSHIEQCEWAEVFPDFKVANRGIPGETTSGLLSRINSLISPTTKLVVIQTGINDILQDADLDIILKNYEEIIRKFSSTDIKIIVTLPFFLQYQPDKNKKLGILIPKIKDLLSRQDIRFIDMTSYFGGPEKLASEFTLDGIHLNANGYKLWISKIDSNLTTLGFRPPISSYDSVKQRNVSVGKP